MFALFLITIVTSILTALLSPTQKAKRGSLKDFSFPQINDGDPITWIFGTVKITAPGLVWYGDYSTKAIKKSTGLFSKSTVGYKYYLGWQLVFCLGESVTMKRLWFGTKSGDTEADAQENDPNFTDPNDPKVPTPIFSGSRGTSQFIFKDDNWFGGDTGGGGVEIQIEFFGGETDQAPSSYLRSKITSGFVPPFRGLCYLTARGYIGNSTQLQTMNGEFQRLPDPLGLGSKATIGSEGDGNPANAVYELLTNNFGAASIPLSKMNAQSFIDTGLRLYDEDEGISIQANGSAAALSNTIQDILRQIDGVLYEDPHTGLINFDLIRADYDIETLLSLDDSSIISISNYAINLWSDTKNRIRLKYTDRLKDYNDRTAVGEDMANVSFQGGQVKAINVEHPHIYRKDHANRKAASELAIYSTPLAKMSTRAHRVSTQLRPGSVLKVAYKGYNVAQIVFRVTKISLGDLINNYLTLELVADKFSKTASIFAPPVTVFQRPITGALSILAYIINETPRWFNARQPNVQNPDASRIMVYPYQPSDSQLSYNLWTKTAVESDYQQIGVGVDFPEFAACTDAISKTSVADIILSSISSADILTNVSVDQIKSQGLNLIQIDDEIMAYETFSLNMANHYVISGVHRGLLDTVPADHVAPCYVTFLDLGAVGQREFGTGDTVDVVMGSVTAAAAQNLDQATSAVVPLQGRAARPLPPVGVLLDGTAYPLTVDNSAGVAVTWKRRDRLKDTISFQDDPDEVPEAETHYWVRFGSGGAHNDVDLGTGTAGTFTFDLMGTNTVEFYSKLGDLESEERITFSTNALHAAGVAVEADLGAPATTTALTATVSISTGAPLATTFTSAVTASIPTSETTSAPLATSTTNPVTASADTGTAPAIGSHRYWGMKTSVLADGHDGSDHGYGFGELRMYNHLGGPNLALAATAHELNPEGNAGSNQGIARINDDAVGQTVGNYAHGNSTATLPDIVYYDFGAPVIINAFTLQAYEIVYAYTTPRDFNLVWSDDGITWTDDYGTTGQTDWKNFEPRTFLRPATPAGYAGSPWGSHTYWQITLDGVETYYYAMGLATLELHAYPGGPDLIQATPGTTIAASSTYSTQSANYLIDGDPTTSWGSDTGHTNHEVLNITFPAPVSVGEFLMQARPAADDPYIFRQAPNNFGIAYSDDGVNWSHVTWYVANQPTWANGEIRNFPDPLFIATGPLNSGTGNTLDDGNGNALEG